MKMKMKMVKIISALHNNFLKYSRLDLIPVVSVLINSTLINILIKTTSANVHFGYTLDNGQ